MEGLPANRMEPRGTPTEKRETTSSTWSELLPKGKREQRVTCSYRYVLFAANRVAHRAGFNTSGQCPLPEKLTGTGIQSVELPV